MKKIPPLTNEQHSQLYDFQVCLYCGQEVENPCRTSGGALNCRMPRYTHETYKIEGSGPKLNAINKKSMRMRIK